MKKAPYFIKRHLLLFATILFTSLSAMSTDFVVTNHANSGVGSLREAITLANADNTATAGIPHTIDITAITGNIDLTYALPAINNHMDITGPGSADLTIRRNSISNFRIFTINTGFTVSISDITISDGLDNSGGGINCSGTLTVTNCILTKNDGGAFYSNGGTLICSNSIIKGNNSSTGSGIINIDNGSLSFHSCVIDSNKSRDESMMIYGVGTHSITSSTISRNETAYGSSVMYLGSGITMSITNTTISENSTTYGDGAIKNRGAFLTMMNCTVTKNSTTSGRVGGFYSSPGSTPGTINISNTIFAGNTKDGLASDLEFTTPINYPSGHNLFGTVKYTGIIPTGDTSTNIKGVTASSVLDLTLANNGGSTKTHALIPCSYAINAGTAAGAPSIDQQGNFREDSVDIGAFESAAGSTGKPSLTTTHNNKTVCATGGTTINIYISGMGLTYQWQVNTGSGIFSDISNTGIYSNANTSMLNISSVAGLHNYQYRCIVTGPCSYSLISVPSSIVLTNAPSFTTQPADKSVCAGVSTGWTVASSGSALTYQWQVDEGLGFVDIPAGYVPATANFYVNSPTLSMNGYSYRCAITNPCTTIYSDAALLTVSSAHSISSQPSNASVCPGSDAGFNISVSGSSIAYQWQVKNGTTFENLTDAGVYSGSTSSTLLITSATLAMDASEYRCQVSNPCTTLVSSVGILTVTTGVSVTVQPESKTVCIGENTSMSISATGTSAYQWQVNEGLGFTNIPDDPTYQNSSTNTLTIDPVLAMSGYLYRCVISASSCAGGTVNSDEATLLVRPMVTIGTQPVSKTVCSGSSTTLDVQASGLDLMYQWEVNQGTGFSPISNTAPYSNATTSSLNVSAVTAGMNGYLYRCLVSDPCLSQVTSGEGTLTVNAPPSILTHPEDTTIYSGASTQMSVSASGPIVSYQWQVNSGSSYINISNSGIYNNATTSSLSLTEVSLDEGGNLYRCIITGSCGTPITSTSSELWVITQEMCFVTVDEITGNNKVVFDKPSDVSMIDSFKVYREGSITGEFNFIGRIGKNEGNTFVDLTSDPVQQSYTYKMAIRNTNGVTSELGSPHTTMHLTINSGTNNTTWNLIWTPYQGFGVTTYNIYRGLSPSTLSLLTSVSGSVTSFTDAAAPVTSNIYYQIEIIGPGCSIPARMASANSVYSNIMETQNAVTGTRDKLSTSTFKVYPNPANDIFYVTDLPAGTTAIKIWDLLGKVIKEIKVEQSIQEVPISDITQGVYILEILRAGDVSARKEIVIE